MQHLNQLFNYLSFLILLTLATGCGDHSTPKVTDDPNVVPLINLTSGPYEVVVGKSVNIGVETKFASNEPVYVILPIPTGVAIVNDISDGRFAITGIKPGTTTFSITDQANPLAAPRSIDVTVKAAPSLEVTPDPITGKVGQTVLLSIATLSPESTASHTRSISDTTIAVILDSVNNPNLISLIKVGETQITIKDVNNNLSEVLTITVTQ